jgi:hypothetical protein
VNELVLSPYFKRAGAALDLSAKEALLDVAGLRQRE